MSTTASSSLACCTLALTLSFMDSIPLPFGRTCSCVSGALKQPSPSKRDTNPSQPQRRTSRMVLQMVGWRQGAPTGQLSAQSDEEMYPQGDGRHSFGTVLSCRTIMKTVMMKFPTQLWWVRVFGHKLRMCLLPVLRVKNIWGYLWSFCCILAAP